MVGQAHTCLKITWSPTDSTRTLCHAISVKFIAHIHSSVQDNSTDVGLTQRTVRILLGPDLQNILRQSYDYLTIMPKLRSTYDGRLIYKTSYEGRKALLRYDSLAKL